MISGQDDGCENGDRGNGRGGCKGGLTLFGSDARGGGCISVKCR